MKLAVIKQFVKTSIECTTSKQNLNCRLCKHFDIASFIPHTYCMLLVVPFSIQLVRQQASRLYKIMNILRNNTITQISLQQRYQGSSKSLVIDWLELQRYSYAILDAEM